MNALINSTKPDDYDIICITESYIYPNHRFTVATRRSVTMSTGRRLHRILRYVHNPGS
jgi:hypothetical protein